MGSLKNILVVEDNMVAALIVSDILSELNFKHAIAGTGKQAILCAKATKYDLILMDIGLPDTNGFEVAKQIRAQENLNKDTPIVALTAHDDEEHRRNAEKVAMNDFMVKPFTLDKGKEICNKFFLCECV